MKIAHLTSAHPRFDTRIFVKQCCSLSKKYQVYLVVADGLGDELKSNVNIVDVGQFRGRKDRIINATKAVYNKAKIIDADIYHLHDPELIPIGLKLKKLGKKVIFDAHEDLPNQIMSKHYLKKPIKIFLSQATKIYEWYACARLDAIVTATPFIRDKFLKINSNTVDVNNYPRIEEFKLSTEIVKNNNQVCYIGGLTDVRGVVEMVESLDFTNKDNIIKIAGNFMSTTLENRVRKLSGWSKVDFIGYVSREEINKTLKSSVAGLVVLHPTRSYIDSLPVKMFEYMCAGIPVIASDFPLWRSIIEDADCGICVDPLAPNDIAKAIDYLTSNLEESKRMGELGKKAVFEKYNWAIEENKLFDLYKKVENN